MSMRRLIAGAAGGLVIAFGAGHTDTLQAQETSAYQSADQQFINHLAAANLLEVRLGQTAESKASNPAAKAFAKRMVEDHSMMQKQWMELASKNRLQFKADLTQQQVAQFDQLQRLSGAEFDRAYMALMVQSHRDEVNVFQNERRAGHSPEVQTLIDKDLFFLQNHLTLAQQIAGQVGADVTATTGAGADTTPVATQPGQPTQTVRADSVFISEVDASNATELRLARMAEGRARDSLVKRFAQNMVTDHDRMQAEWRALSSRTGLQVRASISPRHQEQVTRLGSLSGTEFDRAYMAAMVQNHQENVNAFQDRGRTAQSAEVRQLVERSLPSLRQHLSLAQQVASQVGANITTVATENPRPAPEEKDRQKDEERPGKNIKADAEFIRDVDAGHFLEVRLGRLAQEKGRDAAVKRFGKRMEEDHSALLEQWSNTAARNGWKRKSGMGPNHRVKLERLEKISGKAFDRAYITLMIQNHQDYLNYWRKEGRAAHSAPVRRLVNRGIPILEEHQNMAKRIAKQVGVDAEDALAGRRISASDSKR